MKNSILSIKKLSAVAALSVLAACAPQSQKKQKIELVPQSQLEVEQKARKAAEQKLSDQKQKPVDQTTATQSPDQKIASNSKSEVSNPMVQIGESGQVKLLMMVGDQSVELSGNLDEKKLANLKNDQLPNVTASLKIENGKIVIDLQSMQDKDTGKSTVKYSIISQAQRFDLDDVKVSVKDPENRTEEILNKMIGNGSLELNQVSITKITANEKDLTKTKIEYTMYLKSSKESDKVIMMSGVATSELNDSAILLSVNNDSKAARITQNLNGLKVLQATGTFIHDKDGRISEASLEMSFMEDTSKSATQAKLKLKQAK